MNKLQCVAQKYDWGLKGKRSTVGKLYALGTGNEIQDDTPYAELWMGTHSSGPSWIQLEGSSSSSLLKEWISDHPESLGEVVRNKWNGSLPYLFKVSNPVRN